LNQSVDGQRRIQMYRRPWIVEWVSPSAVWRQTRSHVAIPEGDGEFGKDEIGDARVELHGGNRLKCWWIDPLRVCAASVDNNVAVGCALWKVHVGARQTKTRGKLQFAIKRERDRKFMGERIDTRNVDLLFVFGGFERVRP